jgi:hypothetical protein
MVVSMLGAKEQFSKDGDYRRDLPRKKVSASAE